MGKCRNCLEEIQDGEQKCSLKDGTSIHYKCCPTCNVVKKDPKGPAPAYVLSGQLGHDSFGRRMYEDLILKGWKERLGDHQLVQLCLEVQDLYDRIGVFGIRSLLASNRFAVQGRRI